MPSFKRKRSVNKGVRRVSRTTGRSIRLAPRGGPYSSYAMRRMASTAYAMVNRHERMIETKEGCIVLANVSLPHNNTYLWNVNPIAAGYGTGDPMDNNVGNRIGDQITIRGISAKFFVEAALGRSKVNFRIMLLKGARGATFTRADIYKGMTGNKMIDQLNTEKYTVLAQKTFNVSASNFVGQTVGATGIPGTATAAGMTGNKIVKFWIPGKKFGRGGNIQYEQGTTTPKFYDYRWVIVAYDWYGTPQDVNNVGLINEGYCKMYFKDA